MAALTPTIDYLPPTKDNGFKGLCGAISEGVTLQAAQITQVGTAPYSLVLADHGLENMASTDYVVIIGGETTGYPYVDQSTITETGFDVLGAAATEVLHVAIIGRIQGQIAA